MKRKMPNPQATSVPTAAETEAQARKQPFEGQTDDQKNRHQGGSRTVERGVLGREGDGQDRGQHQKRDGDQRKQVEPVPPSQVAHRYQDDAQVRRAAVTRSSAGRW